MSKGLAKEALVMVDVSSTATVVGEPRSFNVDVGSGMVDMTAMDDDWEEVLPGTKRWSLSMEAFYDPEDDAQAEIESAMFGQSLVGVTFRPQGTGSGKKEYTGNAYIERWAPAGAKDDSVGVTLELRGTGALTPADQV